MKVFTINSQTILSRNVDEVAEYHRIVEGQMTEDQIALTREYIEVERDRLDLLEQMCDGEGFMTPEGEEDDVTPEGEEGDVEE